MKIRLDFVTNSSSSSFILGIIKDLTDKQKDAIIEYVTEHMLGKVIASNKEELNNLIESDRLCYGDNTISEIEQSLENGKIIREGIVSFETDEDLADIYKGLWKAIKDADREKIDLIDTDLYY